MYFNAYTDQGTMIERYWQNCTMTNDRISVFDGLFI